MEYKTFRNIIDCEHSHCPIHSITDPHVVDNVKKTCPDLNSISPPIIYHLLTNSL